MTKRLVDIDDKLLEAAQRALGTSGIKDTVNEALDRASAGEARASEVEAAFATLSKVRFSDADRIKAWR